MSIEHCDNWSIYGGNVAYTSNGVYAGLLSGGFIADPDGVSPGLVWDPAPAGGGQYLRYILAASQPIVGIAERIWNVSIPSTDAFPVIAEFDDASNNMIANVYVNNIGGLTLQLHNGTLYSTAGPAVTANAWWHVECKINITAGTFEIRVEGVQVLYETGIAFSAASVAQISIGFLDSGVQPPHIHYKDFVVWNGAGTQNNDFLGAVIVESLVPNADIAFTWTPTPNTDAGYQILATSPPQDGAVYLDAPNPPPAPYICTMTSLSGDITSVKAIMTMVRAAKIDGGDGSLQIGLISSPASAPATVLGANRPITTAQTYWRDVFELDPKTGSPWLPSAVNLAQFLMNRTT